MEKALVRRRSSPPGKPLTMKKRTSSGEAGGKDDEFFELEPAQRHKAKSLTPLVWPQWVATALTSAGQKMAELKARLVTAREKHRKSPSSPTGPRITVPMRDRAFDQTHHNSQPDLVLR